MTRLTGPAVLAVSGLLALNAAAQMIPFASLPADTKWVVHLDAKALLASPVGRETLASLPGTPGEAKLKAFAAMTSVDVTRDLQAVTFCGAGDAAQGGVAYLRGNWNAKKLTTILAGNDHYAAQAHNRHTVMGWNEQKPGQPAKRQYACFASTNLALLSDRLENVNRALDVLDGRAPRLADSPRLKLFDRPAGHPVLWLAAVGVDELVAGNPQAAVLQQAKSLAVTAVADAQGLQVNAGLKTATPEAAQQLQQVLLGYQSLMLLQAGRNPDLATLAQGVVVRSEGVSVQLTLSLPLDFVRRLVTRKQETGGASGPVSGAARGAF